MKWWGWGHPEQRFQFKDPSGFWERLQLALGPLPQAQRIDAAEQMVLPSGRLSAEDLAELHRILGPNAVGVDREVRLTHALGKSYIDLLRIRSGRLRSAPDAVVFPEREELIPAVLRLAEEKGWALIPFGGGTSVVGGVECGSARITVTLDLQRMNRVLAVNPVARTARVQSGITGPALEARLNADGWTLGHFPQSFEFSTLGGWIATRSAGQNSTRYGKIEDMVAGLRMVSPQGIHIATAMPAEAVGPSLPQCMIGSEGVLGIITEATVRLQPLPETRIFAGYFMPDFLAGIEAVRNLLQAGTRPAVLRLSDPEETALALILGRSSPADFTDRLLRRYLSVRGIPAKNGALLILIVEGGARSVRTERRRVRRYLQDGVWLGSRPARLWYASRFEHPYLRDDLMDRAVMVDTLETAAPWDRIPILYERVKRVLSGAVERTAPGSLILTHLSHAYPDGASLYFTFMGRQRAGEEMQQWLAIKSAATVAILENGGTLSHHHGIGSMHAPWLERYLGAPGIKWLKHMKSGLDPHNILNPWKMTEGYRTD